MPNTKRQPRRSYACGPCKKHKIRCDHGFPCGSCLRYNRQNDCRIAPATVPLVSKKGSVTKNAIIISNSRPLSLNIKPKPVVELEPVLTIKSGPSASLSPNSDLSLGSSTEKESTSHTNHSHEIKIAHLTTFSITTPLPKTSIYTHLGLLPEPTQEHILFLLKLLPPKDQCKLYLDYYLENVDFIYHPLHNQSFLQQFHVFWELSIDQIDPDWLAVLFMALALGALHYPKSATEDDKSNPTSESKRQNKPRNLTNLLQVSSIWFKASRQCLKITPFPFTLDSAKKPTLLALQTFCMAQLYLYATNQIELLNSWLTLAIYQAITLGLHNDTPGSTPFETELRRRVWWDICGCDTYQAFCLGRPCTIRSYDSKVPFPKNCHESDMLECVIVERPLSEPTIMSFQVMRHKCMKILNKICPGINSQAPTYQQVLDTDQELCKYIYDLPWFFKPRSLSPFSPLESNPIAFQDPNFPIPFSIEENAEYTRVLCEMPFIGYQHHVLHTCNCMHRVRIHQQFLNPLQPFSWSACFASIKSMFIAYRNLKHIFENIRKVPHFIPQIHQSYSGAVAQGMFLLVEKPGLVQSKDQLLQSEYENLMISPFDTTAKDFGFICRNIDDVIDDIMYLSNTFDLGIPILSTGLTALKQIRDSIQQELATTIQHPTSNSNSASNPQPTSSIFNNVYSVFGGRQNTEKYLSRCSIDFLVNESPDT